MTTLFIKVTLLFLAGLIALAATKRSTAAMRHVLCVCTLAGSLVLPLAMLLPSKAITLRISAVAAGSQAIAQTRGWGYSASAIWALGSGLLLLRLAIGYWRMRRAIRSATRIELGVYAAEVNVPVACGLLRPVVLMPRAADAWPEWQRAAAVRHERAHIERRDLLSSFVAHLACSFYWFHPFVWVVASLMRREQEAACDDAVLHSGFEPATYAEALLAVARNSTSNLLPGCAMTTQIDVKNRIMRLLDRGIARTTSPTTLRFAALAFAGLVLAIGIPVRAEQVYHASDGVILPRLVQKVDPDYTQEARDEKISGPVMLSLVVGADGLAHEISVLKHLDPGLDQKAIEAIEQWHFAPGTLGGQPVAVRIMIEVNFRIL